MQNEDNKKFSLFFFLFLFTQIIMIFSHPFNLIVFFGIALFAARLQQQDRPTPAHIVSCVRIKPFPHQPLPTYSALIANTRLWDERI